VDPTASQMAVPPPGFAQVLLQIAVGLVANAPVTLVALWIVVTTRREHAKTVDALIEDNKRLEEVLRAAQYETAERAVQAADARSYRKGRGP
jgi:hypothetical protein